MEVSGSETRQRQSLSNQSHQYRCVDNHPTGLPVDPNAKLPEINEDDIDTLDEPVLTTIVRKPELYLTRGNTQ